MRFSVKPEALPATSAIGIHLSPKCCARSLFDASSTYRMQNRPALSRQLSSQAPQGSSVVHENRAVSESPLGTARVALQVLHFVPAQRVLALESESGLVENSHISATLCYSGRPGIFKVLEAPSTVEQSGPRRNTLYKMLGVCLSWPPASLRVDVGEAEQSRLQGCLLASKAFRVHCPSRLPTTCLR